MGERMSGGEDAHRRHTRPTRPVPGADGGHTRVEALLVRALRDTSGGAEREREAVAAFRAARDAGAHRARTRRRDDWRPRGQRHTVRSLRATLSVVLASLTLGGVAVAAIGSAGSPADTADGGGRGTSSASASDGRRAEPAATPSSGTAADRDRPPSAEDTEAHCRAYDQVAGRGRAMDATAWRRLVAAAGGEEKVTAYCAARTASATATPGNGGEGRGAGSADPAGGNAGSTGNTASAGTAGNSGTGTGTAGNTGTAAGSTGGSGGSGNTGNTGNGQPQPAKTPKAEDGDR
ncbi:hypothetical protein [Streptomyces sp. NPDC048737]|uniref:hypothetical protein n=1 Tax=unclassified Streptomyces TaxID=2593676 RepID=UPI003430C177